MRNVFGNSFVQGREFAKRLMIAAVVCAVMGIVCEQAGSAFAPILLVLTLIISVFTVYVIAKYCRCPHCGKRIMTGVLVATTCPSCRRNLTTGKKAKKNAR